MFSNSVLDLEVDCNMTIVEQLVALMEGVFEHLWHSPDQFSGLCTRLPAPPPVPFLGRVDTAVVLTVGVHPTMEQFTRAPTPERVCSAQLSQHLLQYFDSGQSLVDYRLDTWERALNQLGLSYYDGSAAHVEVCPRLIDTPLLRGDHYLFTEMCRYDAPLLFRLLDVLSTPRVLLMAGSITPGYSLSAFLKEVAPERGWQLLGDGQGANSIAYHSLVSEGSSYDAFYANICPANAAGRAILLPAIQEHTRVFNLLTRTATE